MNYNSVRCWSFFFLFFRFDFFLQIKNYVDEKKCICMFLFFSTYQNAAVNDYGTFVCFNIEFDDVSTRWIVVKDFIWWYPNSVKRNCRKISFVDFFEVEWNLLGRIIVFQWIFHVLVLTIIILQISGFDRARENRDHQGQETGLKNLQKISVWK